MLSREIRTAKKCFTIVFTTMEQTFMLTTRDQFKISNFRARTLLRTSHVHDSVKTDGTTFSRVTKKYRRLS